MGEKIEDAINEVRAWCPGHESRECIMDPSIFALIDAVRAEERQRFLALIKAQESTCGSGDKDGPCCLSSWKLEQAVGNT